MPVRLPPLTERAARILFEGIVDYAGLYPPASVSIAAAVRNYAHYRGGGAAWMLGRFVCPAERLGEFSMRADALLPRDAGSIPWRLSAVGSGNPAADMQAIAEFNQRHRVCFDEAGAMVDSYEVRAVTPEDVARVDAAVARDLTTYIEVPLTAEPRPMIDAIARVRRRAKFRMGGVTAEAFPPAESAMRFLAACIELNVPAKATAGLHHPLRGAYRLTYDESSTIGHMFGFLNVFLVAAMLGDDASPEDALPLLRETDAQAFEWNDHSVAWRGPSGIHHFDRALLQRVRDRIVISFGSCSFTEPVSESRALGFE